MELKIEEYEVDDYDQDQDSIRYIPDTCCCSNMESSKNYLSSNKKTKHFPSKSLVLQYRNQNQFEEENKSGEKVKRALSYVDIENEADISFQQTAPKINFHSPTIKFFPKISHDVKKIGGFDQIMSNDGDFNNTLDGANLSMTASRDNIPVSHRQTHTSVNSAAANEFYDLKNLSKIRFSHLNDVFIRSMLKILSK